MGILHSVYTNSPRDWVQKFGRRLRGDAPRRYVPPTADFLRSDEYHELMNRHLPYGNVYDRHEAQNRTQSFCFRHFEIPHRLGVFRWRGMQEHLGTIMELVLADGADVLDVGGAAGPLGLGSKIVDRLPADAAGRPVPYRDLADVPGPVDVIFSSHCIEHVADLDGLFGQMRAKLKPSGRLIAFVPAFTCERWRASVHTNAKYHDHVWTFSLAGTAVPDGLVGHCEIDVKLAEFFKLEEVEYCGDDSIFIQASGQA
jgi:hypothetical protein